MAIIIILIAYVFDYKSQPKGFVSDLKGGITIFALFIIYALLLKFAFHVNVLYIIFSIGIEIIILFAIKALIDSNRQ